MDFIYATMQPKYDFRIFAVASSRWEWVRQNRDLQRGHEDVGLPGKSSVQVQLISIERG